MTKCAKSQAGISLIELTVTVALVGGLLLLAGQLLFDIQSRRLRVERSLEAQRLIDSTRRALMSTVSCTSNLKGLKLEAKPDQPTKLVQIDQYDKTGSKSASVLSVGSSASGISVVDAQLRFAGDLKGNHWAAQVEVSLQLASQNQPKLARVPVLLNMKDHQIIECVSLSGSGNFDLEHICYATGQGYDPKTETCEPRETIWHLGDRKSATCPSGYSPDTAMDRFPCLCVAPGGFVDAGKKDVDRFFVLGGKKLAGNPAALESFDGRDTCSCVYAIDTDTSGFRTSIRCLEDSVKTGTTIGVFN